ncbi:MAG: GIY-YIG nuclease family protein [Chlorobiaceae bacterium]|nr:GIY-YIG nuclease family protein [Chlorobiaceae bacterium]
MLHSESADRYYIGISSDPERRRHFHNTIEKGFTSRYRPWSLVYVKEYSSKTDAHAAESKVKNWKSRKMIERLIAGELWIFLIYFPPLGTIGHVAGLTMELQAVQKLLY